MNRFDASKLFFYIRAIEGFSGLQVAGLSSRDMAATLKLINNTYPDAALLRMEGITLDAVRNVLVGIEKTCLSCGFSEAQEVAATSLARIDSSPQDYSSIRVETASILDSILRELRKRCFIAVTQSRALYVESENLLGDKVPVAFKSAVTDIVSAGNCLAARV